jgi:hypothetical protein
MTTRTDSMMSDAVDVDAPAEENTGVNKAYGRDRLNMMADDDEETAPAKAPEIPQLDSEPKESGIKKEEEKKEKKPEKKESKKEDKEEDDSEDEKEEKKEEEKEVAAKKKYKYKSDGEDVEEELDDEEVSKRLSASRAIDKRFAEHSRNTASLKKEREDFTKDYEYIKGEMLGVKESFASAIDNFKKNGYTEKNPTEGVYNLLDKMGLDTREYDKALFFHFVPEVARFLDMDEVGREAFILKKENEWYQKDRDKLTKREQEANEYRSKLEEENSLKRQNGVSEEQFSELADELESKFGLAKPKTEQVIQWAKERPFYERAEVIAQKVPGTDVIKLARIFLEFPTTTDDEVLSHLGYKQIQEKEITEKLKSKLPPKKERNDSKIDNEVDDIFFKQFRNSRR